MLSSELKSTIQAAYRQFLEKRELKARHGQKLMIANIANTLANIQCDTSGKRIDKEQAHIAVVEAGTGTGKTVAYLLATIPVAQALKKKCVISTATIALQEQIVLKDLPDIKENTDLAFNFTLAKGRGRYLCLSKLDRILSDHDAPLDLTQSFTENTAPTAVDEDTITLYQSMVDALAAGQWDGDRDAWSEEVEQSVWNPVTTNHRECTGRRCSNVNSCSFFKAREAIERFDVIVANHDLVLADLALGGGAILPPPEETIYIFDEGHHLPDKALGHFSQHTRLAANSKWLEQSHKSLSSLLGDIGGAGQIDRYAEELPALFLDAKQRLDSLYVQCQQLLDHHITEEGDRYSNKADAIRHRFPHGQPPQVIVKAAEELHLVFEKITRLLNQISVEMQEAMEDGYSSVPKVDLENWFPVIGNWQSRAEANTALWHSYAIAEPQEDSDDVMKAIPVARWLTAITFSGTMDFELCSSPILAANTLKHRLWGQCYGAVVTSATLTALGKYDRFMMRAGTTEAQHYSVMPSPFDFSRATLSIPKDAIEANQVQEHTQYIVDVLPELLEQDKGALVLFSSRRQMEAVFDLLSEPLKDTVLVQGDYSKQAMLKKHKQRIEEGKQSVLFGLASFAEGVDLPGEYCEHVIIAKLPFAVPDDPIEASLSEWIEQKGGNPFMDITIPEAAIRLVQACGRLLRKESDSGRITILDRRLVTKRYGKLLLNTLPAYQFKLDA